MLDHLGEREAHSMIVAAITKVLSTGTIRTPDMGGKATTKAMAAAIQAAV
jgi:tartrate dehydrogenase/decarboxylase/D-malate dehydrogenase